MTRHREVRVHLLIRSKFSGDVLCQMRGTTRGTTDAERVTCASCKRIMKGDERSGR